MKQWKLLEVTDVASGERIKIKDYRFNPSLHKNPKLLAGTVVDPNAMFGFGGRPIEVEEAVSAPVVEEEIKDEPKVVEEKDEPVEDAKEPVVDPERPFACDQCDKTFKRAQDVKTHVKLKHSE